jgi:hypothetical protein
MGHKEIRWGGVEWVLWASSKEKWWAVVSMVINFCFTQNVREMSYIGTTTINSAHCQKTANNFSFLYVHI